MGKVYCIGVSGKPITEKIAEVLFINAVDLLESGKERKQIKGKGYDGFISTERERVTLVTISGVSFEADLITDKGETKVFFIVRDGDLEGFESAKFYVNNDTADVKSESAKWN